MMTPKQILQNALTHLTKPDVKWGQGNDILHNPDRHYCLCTAASQPPYSQEDSDYGENWKAAWAHFLKANAIPRSTFDPAGDAVKWNDMPGRTREEVITALQVAVA